MGKDVRGDDSLDRLFDQVQAFALHDLLLAIWKSDAAVIIFEA